MSITTTDHDQIRTWVEDRSGVPALTDSPDLGGPPVPALIFPGEASSPAVREVGWDEWFVVFDRSNLALRHPEDAPADVAPFFELLAR